MEIEAKFRVEERESFAVLRAASELGGYVLRCAPHPEQQRNTYYDTADGRLAQARYGLRIREIDGRSVATLKGPGTPREGLHQRAEWEVPAHHPDPATWPESAAREEAQRLLGGAELLPLLTIETSRHHIVALRQEESGEQQEIAELALDEGIIQAKGRTRPFRELEIELLPSGTHADLEALVAAVQHHMPLIPENRSKLEQGLALLKEKKEEET